MSKFSIDKTASGANNTQNPYDFNGVSVSFSINLTSPSHHRQATRGAPSGLEAVSRLAPPNSAWEPR